LNPESLDAPIPNVGALGATLHEYFEHRAAALQAVSLLLMTGEQARVEFERLRRELNPTCPIPMNKQTGEKARQAYLTGIVNMLIEANVGDHPVNYDPRTLTTVTANMVPVRTLSRRVDGAFPSPINPIAIWEVKEYYWTTTFGSRIADGIFETQLDGMELEELSTGEGVNVLHYLIADSHYVWWELGRSYLCRIVDMLHMGYVDEVLFGREVLTRLPELVAEWVAIAERNRAPVVQAP